MIARYRRSLVRPRLLCALLIVSELFLNGQVLSGQDDSRTSSAETHFDRNSVSLPMVGAVANGSLQGTSNDRRMFLIGASYNRLLSRKRLAQVTFTSQVIPVALLREP